MRRDRDKMGGLARRYECAILITLNTVNTIINVATPNNIQLNESPPETTFLSKHTPALLPSCYTEHLPSLFTIFPCGGDDEPQNKSMP